MCLHTRQAGEVLLKCASGVPSQPMPYTLRARIPRVFRPSGHEGAAGGEPWPKGNLPWPSVNHMIPHTPNPRKCRLPVGKTILQHLHPGPA